MALYKFHIIITIILIRTMHSLSHCTDLNALCNFREGLIRNSTTTISFRKVLKNGTICELLNILS